MLQTEFEGEVYTHRYIWQAANAMRDRVDGYTTVDDLGEPFAVPPNPRGALHFDMTAMLMSVAAVEAYCNFIIETLDPVVFANERKVFRKGGLRGKVEWINSRAFFGLDWSAEPFKTFDELKGFRDVIMHAKPERYAGTHEHGNDTEPPFMEPGRVSEARPRDDANRRPVRAHSHRGSINREES